MCANDNLELACAFVQKTATEKAVIEIDRYLKIVSNIYYLLFIKNILLIPLVNNVPNPCGLKFMYN